MSDYIEGKDTQGSDEVGGAKRGSARGQVDAARRAGAEGEDGTEQALLDQALHTDPEGLANALAEEPEGAAFADDAEPADDDEVARISREIRPHSDAPSRAGITGSGSGADGMGE